MKIGKRPDRFSGYRSRLSSSSAQELRWTRVTVKPVRSGNGKVNALREPHKGVILQSQSQEELDALLPSVLDRAFKGEL